MQSFKVEDVTFHTTTKHPNYTALVKIPVVKGILMLIETTLSEGMGKGLYVNGKYCIPVIISKTEEINPYDYVVHTVRENENEVVHEIRRVGGIVGEETLSFKDDISEGQTFLKCCKKVLALPEHLTAEHYQAIGNEEIKNGSTVLLECYGATGCWGVERLYGKAIIIHSIFMETKKYTFEDMDQLRRMALSYGASDTLNSWFNENVKTKL